MRNVLRSVIGCLAWSRKWDRLASLAAPRRTWSALAFVVGLGVGLPGCDRPAGQEPSAPARQVSLQINAWTGYVQPYIPQFKQYAREHLNVDVDIAVTQATGLDSFTEHLRNRTADLISPANDLLLPLVRQQLIRPIDRSAISNFNQINPIILRANYFEIDGQTYAVPFTFGPYAIAYNRRVMAEPRSYSALWSPDHKKKVSISGSYDTANIYMTALMLGMPRTDLFSLHDEQLARIEAKLRELHQHNIYAYWGDNLDPEHCTAIDVGTDWGVGVHEINAHKGGDWALTIPEEGATGWVDNWAVAAHIAPEKLEVAYALIDFLISSPVQAEVARNTTYGPVNSYATRHFSREEKVEFHITDPNYLGRLILWQPLAPEVLRRYQDLWQRVRGPTTAVAAGDRPDQ